MKPNQAIFVFGSNLRGRHGKGGAFYAARYYGAIEGQGKGLQGESYAIPTKDEKLAVLPLREIKRYVDEFIKFANNHPEMTFKVTSIGTGLAEYTADDIAPMFIFAPTNCILPLRWKNILPEIKGRLFWVS